MVVATKTKKPRHTPTHRKRHGLHQRRSHHFTKTYWPYIPLLLIVGLGMFLNTLLAGHGSVLSYATEMSPSGLLTSTNQARAQNSLGSLAINSQLTQAAQAKANDMVARNYWSHTTPDGKDPWVFITAAGYTFQTAGENLAYGFSTSGDTVTGWMNSPGHRANILNTTYREVGFGIANAPDYQSNGEETVVVAMYAEPAELAAVASQPAKATPAKSAPAPTKPVLSSDVATPTTTPSPSTQQPIAARADPAANGKFAVTAVVPEQAKVARVQLTHSNIAPWSVTALFMLAVIGLLIFTLRHSLAWHRAWVRGETFVLTHKFLDFIIVAGIMACYLLTRTVGTIL